jgi:uncharacterized protein (TIRG00374 family)
MIRDKVMRHKRMLSILISLIMIVIVVSLVGVGEIIDALSTIEKQYLALALALFVISLVIGAIRWRALIESTQTRTEITKILEYTLVDKFANSFFPTAAMGMALRSVLMEREYDVPKSKGLATIMLDYGIDILGTFVVAVPCYLYLANDLPSNLDNTFRTSLITIGVVFGLVFLVSSADILISRGMHGTIPHPTIRGRRLFEGKLTQKFLEFSKTFSILLTTPRTLVWTLMLTFAKVLVDALRVYVLFWAFGISVPLYYFILFDSAWVFLSPLMFTPGGVGVVEIGRIALYSLIPAVSPGVVAPVVFIDRLITYWLMVAVGAVVFFATGVDATVTKHRDATKDGPEGTLL